MAIELNDIIEKQDATSAAKAAPTSLSFFRPKVSSSDRRFFTEQLSLMLETGANLHQALVLLKQQDQLPAMASVIDDLENGVAGGRSFSAALADHPEVFSTTYVNLVAASEGGGFIHEVLAELLRMDEQAEELNNTVRSALSYPIFLSLFSLGVIVFVLMVVFPKFSVMFAKIHDQLPMTTIVLMHASDFLRDYWMQMIAAIAAITMLTLQWARKPTGRETIDRLKLTLPGIKHIFMQVYLTQSLRVMSLSLANGVNITDTLIATRDIVRNSIFRRFFVTIEEQVSQGNGVAIGFRQNDMIPLLAQQMIATGEETGSLSKVMSRLADYYERELTKRLKSMSKMAEPIMLMVMGVIVGVIVSSLILPIFKLSRAVT
ncbi:MAG: type II secretion system F family protein [Gammaproteobacteria bacterium]|nr:type II secretion system F family protein [Gammaproteobacteria bacterium]MDH3416536.1 type II secretion system F family protein [Gammaproteobacteria bacterium]